MDKHNEFFKDEFAYRVANVEFTAAEGVKPHTGEATPYSITVSDTLTVEDLLESGVFASFTRALSTNSEVGVHLSVRFEFNLNFLNEFSPKPEQDRAFWKEFIYEHGAAFTSLLCSIGSNILSNLMVNCTNAPPVITPPNIIQNQKA